MLFDCAGFIGEFGFWKDSINTVNCSLFIWVILHSLLARLDWLLLDLNLSALSKALLSVVSLLSLLNSGNGKFREELTSLVAYRNWTRGLETPSELVTIENISIILSSSEDLNYPITL